MNTAIDGNERRGRRKRDPMQRLAGSWRLIGALLVWLTGLNYLSEDEIHAAGIYVGDPR